MSTALQQGRINKILDTKQEFGEFGVMTRRQWLQECFNSEYYHIEVEASHPFSWNRKKFNNMDNESAVKYEASYNKLKTDYRMFRGLSTFTSITKTEYEYYQSLGRNDDTN